MLLQRHLKIVDCGTDSGKEDSFMDTALKVAFATTDMKTVNQHFGSAESFAIYALDMNESRLLEVMQFGQLAQDGNEDKLAEKMNALEGCIAVYSQAIGASAVAQLKARNIQPVKVTPGAHIADMLESLQDELCSGPNAWLARAIAQHKGKDPTRFEEMEADGWEE